MVYYHILVWHQESPSRPSLLFKDLSETELRTPFLMGFIRSAQGVLKTGGNSASKLGASIIRTERKHDKAVSEYLRDWAEKAEEFMRASGYPVNSQPMGDSAIMGAGQEVTAEFLRSPAARDTEERNKEARKRTETLVGGGLDPIADQIARGMMMRYESGDPRRDGKVSVKTLSKRTLHDDAVRQKFRCLRREVCASRRVDHANIVRVLYAGEDGDVIYLGTEHIDGQALHNFFAAGERFSMAEAVFLMGDLCAALHAAHEAGIVHCNVTPASVFIDARGCLKLGDFGYARFDGAEAAENEPPPDPGRTSDLAGTPAYLSPEAVSGAMLDRRTDIFSAGAILYQLLSGQQAFAGPGPWTTAKQVLQEDPLLPSLLDEAISPHFDEVVRKALAKDVNDRYQTAAELDAALQAAMGRSRQGR